MSSETIKIDNAVRALAGATEMKVTSRSAIGGNTLAPTAPINRVD